LAVAQEAATSVSPTPVDGAARGARSACADAIKSRLGFGTGRRASMSAGAGIALCMDHRRRRRAGRYRRGRTAGIRAIAVASIPLSAEV
jgi:hypothetical protein